MSTNERPRVTDAEKLRQERTVSLTEIAKIITPKKVAGKSGLVIKTRDFVYPLNPKGLAIGPVADLQIQAGDILLSQAFHGSNKFYLVHEPPHKACYPSTFLTVIRLTTDKVVPEYLFFYLQSETIARYFLEYRSGTFFPRLTLTKLRALPVVVPELQTQAKSKSVFRARHLTREEDLIAQVNAPLFAKGLPEKPIQREFVEELMQGIWVLKQEVMDKIIRHDLQELEGCSRNRYYKSLVILAGSLLEAFLLDWLSEIEGKDYFTASGHMMLGSLLNKLPGDVVNERVIGLAKRIKDARNMVHPKAYFQGEKIDHKLCEEILTNLRLVIQSRKRHE